MLKNPDLLPQLIGEFRPVDEWQTHVNQLFYRLKGASSRQYYPTFAGADYRLAHALAAEYYERVCEREKSSGVRREASDVRRSGDEARTEGRAVGTQPQSSALSPQHSLVVPPLTIMEWGPGNGNLAACFLSHLKRLDKDGRVYSRVRYVLVDNQEEALQAALVHADLAEHRARVGTLQATVEDLGAVKDGTVDRILCNELWNNLPTKLMLRQGGEVQEEYIRPNLGETKHGAIDDWAAFVRAFDAGDIAALNRFPPFLEDIIWEKEYRKAEWKSVPYRKTLTEFLKQIDEEVLVPVNLGACATVKEAKRLLARTAIGLNSFDAGTADRKVLNDPEKPCYGQFGGQYSFMVNFALVEAVARHLGAGSVTVEPQKEFVGRALGTNVITLMDLLATHPAAGSMRPWEQDRLIIKTIRALNETYHSPCERKIEFPLREEMPPEERRELEAILHSLNPDGVPDTIAYLTEEEVFGAMQELEGLGYDRQAIPVAFTLPPQPVDYHHFFFRPA